MSESSLNIAFATSDESTLDQHFGSCQQMSIYRLTPNSSEHIQTVIFKPSEEGHNQQKIRERLDALSDCFAVYCLACGNPVRQQLLIQGTRVVIHSEDLIENILPQIQTNWPGKIALRQERQLSKKKDADYFSKLAESEWE